MSSPKKMILRVQSSEGTSRVEVNEMETTASLYENVHAALQLPSFAFALHRDRGRRDEILSSKSRTLRDAGLRHGDMLYLSPVDGAILFSQNDAPQQETTNEEIKDAGTSSVTQVEQNTVPVVTNGKPVEDEVDLELYKQSGLIHRARDEKLCRHNSNSCCVHCSPLEPWDENYLKEQNIKHMSFHSYLRKLSAGKSFISLEEPSFGIKPGCTEHPAWPRGACGRCRPGAVTLARQPLRLVDNVLVEHPALVDRFLEYWRRTGQQRLGFLYGRYEPHPHLPLAVRARVAAIYEPPQTGGRDFIRLHEHDPLAEHVADVAGLLGLRRVGWIFTDLLPDMRRVRGAGDHLLSAQECITAAHFQNEHPSPCRHSPSGYYGSKFVTVCCTADGERRVSLEGYQVSLQCAALVRHELLLPTKDAPDLGYIREQPARPDHYIPHVYYKERDSYGNEVSKRAGAVPVEYLLVDVPGGVEAAGGRPLLWAGATFPPAHRAHSPPSLAAWRDQLLAAGSPLRAAADLHALVFLRQQLPRDDVAALCAAVLADDELAAAAAAARPALADLERRALHAGTWTCAVCTFTNRHSTHTCDMCNVPRTDDMS